MHLVTTNPMRTAFSIDPLTFQLALNLISLFKIEIIHQNQIQATKRTAKVLVAMMNDVFDFMNFTTEIGEDFPDGKVPSLDINIWVEEGRILYEFFEKLMATNLMVEADSALSR